MASYEEIMGSIDMMALPWAMRNYALCDGSRIPISQNNALYSLINWTWGGDQATWFALPDMRGRVPVGYGQQQGGAPRGLGQVGGTETVSLTVGNLPPHVHEVPVQITMNGDLDPITPVGSAAGTGGPVGTTLPTGSAEPVDVMQPFAVVGYQIAIVGIYPSRDG